MKKSYLEMIKDIFSNKKQRAGIMLVFYLVFFVILVVLIRGNQSPSYLKPIVKDPIKEKDPVVEDHTSFIDWYGEKKLYYSEIEATIHDNDIHFYMSCDENGEVITGFENIYYIEDEQVYYLIDDMKIVPDFKYVYARKLRPSFLARLIDEERFVSKTEYADGSLLYTYTVDYLNFYEVMGGETTYQNIEFQFLVLDRDILSVHMILDQDEIMITYFETEEDSENLEDLGVID